MGQVDAANQLRSYFTALPNRCEKEFFPGVFWSLDVTLVNCYKIFITLYPEEHQTSTGNRDRNSHRKFMEAFIDEVFQYRDSTFETFPEKLEKKWEKIPRGCGRPSLARSILQTQETFISTPLEGHQHINTTKRSDCISCGFIRRKIDQDKPEKNKKIRVRGANTSWKCTICGPICKEASCWDFVHSEGFRGRKRKYSEIA
jgi:hypothetical protein